ncbi:cytochrome P450 [Nocardia transvalensis]|uniref:cytochrome P450 n=1 Tax=Nocardia transvalensis TaxID=37333 RepID=UPI001895D7B6|nr:cytochrome P450 [Nocardia transvalensis]MBF6329961.1 cytochrome P450 [Nocardia transvalensis]
MLRIFGEEFARNPWPVLESLRTAGGVHRVATPDGPPAWLVTRFDDVYNGLLDHRLTPHLRHARGRDYRGFDVPPPLDVFQNSDPEVVARMRRTVTAELHPRRASEWADRAGEVVRSQLERLDGTTEFDLVERLAVPLPATVLADLLGLPGTVRDQVLEWATSTLRPGAAPRARDTLATMQQIIAAAIACAREVDDETMLARLVQAGELNPDELAGVVFYLLFVWYEVLIDVISGAVLTFSGNPDQLEEFRTSPDLLGAVDELLRFLSPQVLAGPRFAVTEIDIGNHTIDPGQTVLLCLASANHDAERFTAPDELDVHRTHNPHLALGHGTRACLGTGVVRPVAAAVLTEIYAHWPGLRVIGDEESLPWRSGFRHRGPLTVPVKTQ